MDSLREGDVWVKSGPIVAVDVPSMVWQPVQPWVEKTNRPGSGAGVNTKVGPSGKGINARNLFMFQSAPLNRLPYHRRVFCCYRDMPDFGHQLSLLKLLGGNLIARQLVKRLYQPGFRVQKERLQAGAAARVAYGYQVPEDDRRGEGPICNAVLGIRSEAIEGTWLPEQLNRVLKCA